MAYGSLLSDSEFLKINGSRITAIYGRMETAFRTDQLLVDAYDKKPDYYLLVTEDRDYDYKKNEWIDKPDIKTKKLPKEIAALFGPQEINGTKVYVTRMSIRKRCSGNGSFTDQTFDFGGGCGALSKTISYYRLKRWDNAYNLSVFQGEELGKKFEKAIVGKSYKVEALPDWFDIEYPCSYIRTEGGLNYPDVKLDSWRWSFGRPYVSNDYSNNYPNKKHIRVFHAEWNAHLYFEAVDEPKEGDDNLVQITFSYGYEKKGDQFCHIAGWNETKKEDPNGIIRWKILKVNEKENWPYEVAAVINDKIQFKRTACNLYYRLVRMAKI